MFDQWGLSPFTVFKTTTQTSMATFRPSVYKYIYRERDTNDGRDYGDCALRIEHGGLGVKRGALYKEL